LRTKRNNTSEQNKANNNSREFFITEYWCNFFFFFFTIVGVGVYSKYTVRKKKRKDGSDICGRVVGMYLSIDVHLNLFYTCHLFQREERRGNLRKRKDE